MMEHSSDEDNSQQSVALDELVGQLLVVQNSPLKTENRFRDYSTPFEMHHAFCFGVLGMKPPQRSRTLTTVT